MGLSAAHEVDDFDLVTLPDRCLRERATLEDREVLLDGHAACVNIEQREQLADRQAIRDVERISVEGDRQGEILQVA
jgi:hypothetical protein